MRRGGRRSVGRHLDLGLQDLGLARRRAPVGGDGLGQAVEQRVELEELEQPADLGDVEALRGPLQVGGAQLQRHVPHEDHHLDVLADVGLVGGQVLPRACGVWASRCS